MKAAIATSVFVGRIPYSIEGRALSRTSQLRRAFILFTKTSVTLGHLTFEKALIQNP
jgi:hypothetical protein